MLRVRWQDVGSGLGQLVLPLLNGLVYPAKEALKLTLTKVLPSQFRIVPLIRFQALTKSNRWYCSAKAATAYFRSPTYL